jgi:hypothetical protein
VIWYLGATIVVLMGQMFLVGFECGSIHHVSALVISVTVTAAVVTIGWLTLIAAILNSK